MKLPFKKKRLIETEEYIMDGILSSMSSYRGAKRIQAENEMSVSIQFDELLRLYLQRIPNGEAMRSVIVNRLVSDRYISEFAPRYITDDGIRFISNGGYQHQKKEKDLDLKIKEKSLQKFVYDKLAFWISIGAFIVSIIALFKTELMQLLQE